jgi:DnaJ-like protein
MHIVIGFLSVLLLFSLIRYGLNCNAKQRRQLAYIVAVGLAGTVLLLMLLTGRIHYLAAVAAAILPFIKKLPGLLRYIPLFKYLKQPSHSAPSSNSGNQSSVETSLFIMTLDHDSGEMDGEILEGDFKGEKLKTLSQQQLFLLYKLAVDQYKDSIAVFDAFLDRHIGKNWRELAEQYSHRFDDDDTLEASSEMSVSQAMKILGLEEGATKDEIQDAHRRLMQKLHPDRGGSNFLAAQVNLAKDILLEKLASRKSKVTSRK